MDARTLALSQVTFNNTTFKSNSVARQQQPQGAPTNRVAVSNSVARGPTTNQNTRTASRGHEALDLVVTSSELKKNADKRAMQLDQFDSNEDGFKKELNGELDKLDSGPPRRGSRRDSL